MQLRFWLYLTLFYRKKLSGDGPKNANVPLTRLKMPSYHLLIQYITIFLCQSGWLVMHLLLVSEP